MMSEYARSRRALGTGRDHPGVLEKGALQAAAIHPTANLDASWLRKGWNLILSLSARDTEGQQPNLEQRLDQLEKDVAVLRLVVGTDPRFLHGSREELAEVARWEDDGIPF